MKDNLSKHIVDNDLMNEKLCKHTNCDLMNDKVCKLINNHPTKDNLGKQISDDLKNGEL